MEMSPKELLNKSDLQISQWEFSLSTVFCLYLFCIYLYHLMSDVRPEKCGLPLLVCEGAQIAQLQLECQSRCLFYWIFFGPNDSVATGNVILFASTLARVAHLKLNFSSASSSLSARSNNNLMIAMNIYAAPLYSESQVKFACKLQSKCRP